MSVLYSNPYACLDDSNDNEPVQKSTPKESSKPETKKDNTRSKPGENSSRSRNEYPRRGNNKDVVGASGSNRDSAAGHTVAVNFEDSPAAARAEMSTRGGRGVSSSRGARGGRNFDRHSRNDRYDGEKKDVAGAGSWGEPISSELEVIEGEDAAPVVDAIIEPVEPVEPEIEHKTLEQYLAEKNASKKFSGVTPRQANEGADDSQWKDAVVFSKEEEDFLVLSKPKTFSGSKAKAKVEKQHLDIEQRFTDSGRSDSGDRGGRGGSRGDRGSSRGMTRGGRGGRGASSANVSRPVNVTDHSAFPSLS